MSEAGSDKKAEKARQPEAAKVVNTSGQGIGSQTHTACDENAGDETLRLMEEVLRHENLEQAYKRVKRNKGAAGVDGMTVGELQNYVREHWTELREQLLNETYQPRPVKRIEIPKPGGKGVRMLGIPVVFDRLIQQAILQVLTPIYDPTFSENSHGFRPGRSAHDAILKARDYINEGYDWVVDADLEKFFMIGW
jgi:RNA-directed DNA polymerase